MQNIIPLVLIAAAAVFVAYKFGWLDRWLKKDVPVVPAPKPAPDPVPVPHQEPPKTDEAK